MPDDCEKFLKNHKFLEKIMEPFMNPEHYHLQKENLWMWETGFLFFAAVLLAVIRRYTRFLSEHPRLLLAECLLWGANSAAVIMGLMIWRGLNGGKIEWRSSLRLGVIVGIAVIVFSLILEIGGVNTVILSEKYKPRQCTLSRDYCDAEESKLILFEVASIWMILFIYVITAYFCFNRQGIFATFSKYYYPRPLGQGVVDRFIGTIVSMVSYAVICLLSWIMLILLTPLYCLFFLFVPHKTLGTFQNLWLCMKDMLFLKIPAWNDWKNGYILFLWQLELVVFGLIFAAPVLFVIWNRLRTETPPTIPVRTRPDRVLYQSEFSLLFGKYVLLIGLKMMLEIILSP